MSKSGRGLTDEEKRLWRRVASRIKPRRAVATEGEASAALAATPSRLAPPDPSTPAKLQDKAATPGPVYDRRGEKRVRRGQLEIGATLDLHGHTQATGRAAAVRFLTAAHGQGLRTVIIITGVGRDGRGVLKRRLPEWLAEPDLRKLVSGFAEAHRSHGGAGAYYVFLRAHR